MYRENKLMKDKVLCIDLDDTLIKTDMLLESILILLKTNILFLFLLPLWLCKGKANLKHQIAKRIEFDPTCLPYNIALLNDLRQQKAQGRHIALATASNQKIAYKIAEYLNVFDRVFASDGKNNLSGEKKQAVLQAAYKETGFEYIDTPPSFKMVTIKSLLRATRVHQWVKNILIFVPLITAYQFNSVSALLAAVMGFFSFCLGASALYVVNDLLDLEADRKHPTKKNRAFAAGDIPLRGGIILVPLLLILAIGLACLLPIEFLWTLLGYLFLSMLYSLYLKKAVFIDVILLSLLYTIRIIAGATATGIPLSEWLLAFSVFLFLSLAMMKRVSELYMLREQATENVQGRGYLISDREQVASLGGASGYIAVLVFALYVGSNDILQLYTYPKILWLICPLLLYWISRAWLLSHRGQMHDDPIVFALKDKVSYGVGLLTIILILFAK
jgi:4-hydroxybenzoate polyprenyltransferase